MKNRNCRARDPDSSALRSSDGDSQARDRGSSVARKIGSQNESDVSEVRSSKLRTSDEGVRGKAARERRVKKEADGGTRRCTQGK